MTNEIMAGTLSGFLIVIIITAVTALVFKGSLAIYFPIGIGCALIGSVVVNFITAYFGSIHFSISRPDPAVGAILAIMFLNIATYPLNEGALLATLMAALMLVSLLVGFFMFFLGYFKLAQAVRFLPYPVLGGVIVGSSWIIARSSFYFISNNSLTIQNTLQPNTLLQLSLAMGFALFSLVVNKRAWILPVSVLIFSILINICLNLNHVSHAEAIHAGWLLAPVKPAFVFNSIDFSMLEQIGWSAVVYQIGYIASLAGLIVIILLLNVTALEITEKFNANLDQELKVAGVANIIGGLFCAFPCNLSLSGTILNKSIGGVNRFSGVTASCVCMIIFLLFPHLVSFMPVPIIGGLLFFLAFKLMIEWLYYGWYKLPHIDYTIVITIGLIISAWNFLSGVFIGIIITCIVFVVNYAKINPIKFATSGKYCHSNVLRPHYEQQWLAENGFKIRLFKLQGYLFFGSTKLLLDNIRRLITKKANRVQFLVFDFQLVNGFDSSTSLSWIRLQQLINPSNLHLIFTHCSEKVIQQLKQHSAPDEPRSIRFFPDVDQGLEWCEQQILKDLPAARKPVDSSIGSLLNQVMPDTQQQQIFAQNLEKFVVTPGQYLFKQGEKSNSLYFIETGEVSIFLETYNAKIRLSKSGPGTIVGELGFYLHINRSASVCADTTCVVYKLKRDALEKLEQTYPNVALVFHKNIIDTLANRLVQTNYLLEITGFL
ncbi:MAG: SulP family inorganic anion transporter [Tatlockia sp.]|jgi:SulP family sulfate permease